MENIEHLYVIIVFYILTAVFSRLALYSVHICHIYIPISFTLIQQSIL